MDNELLRYNIIDALGEKLGSFLDIKDSLLENEYAKLFGDSFKVVALLRKANMLVSQKRFEAFLKGFRNAEKPTEEELTKLLEYIDNEQKAEFIADTLQKILLSKSSKSCLILGTIIQDLINNKADLTHEDLVCLDALVSFFDYDIENFIYICDYAIQTKKKEVFHLYWQFKEKCKKDGLSVTSILLTVEKAVAHQLLNKDIEVNFNINSDDIDLSEAENDVDYSLTLSGNKLYKYILRISKKA